MRTGTLAAMILAATMATAQARQIVGDIHVCAQMEPGSESEHAQTLAAVMFERIGVNLHWHGLRHCPADAIQLSFSRSTPPTLKPGALAYAMPYEGTHIVVFLDRAEAIIPVQGRILLAHVFVHEISHILQGVSRHSAEGVMKANWGPNDYRKMKMAPLSFTATDIELIHLGIDGRASLLASSAKAAASRVTEVAAAKR
jgi:hypothetical protein